ncbi:MAG: protein of unknown function, DUF3592 [Candidatus Nanosalina sp. J07AB43]|nr:MAG: protein of unknown function, DUF3592 [Candidatus Nanosalina sp. J07AB43]
MFGIDIRSGWQPRGEGKGDIPVVLAILVGVGMVFLGYNTYVDQRQALNNPENVSATVVDTGIREDSSRRGGIDFSPVIEFRYTYNGSNYTSNSMYPGGQGPDEHNLESEAREVVQNYSQGSRIQVLVPPERPQEGFIKAEKTSDGLVFIGVGFLFLGVGSYRFLKQRYL